MRCDAPIAARASARTTSSTGCGVMPRSCNPGRPGDRHSVDLHQLHLIARHRRARQHFRDARQHMPGAERKGHQRGSEPRFLRDRAQELLIGEHARAAELVQAGLRLRPLQDRGRWLRPRPRPRPAAAVSRHARTWDRPAAGAASPSTVVTKPPSAPNITAGRTTTAFGNAARTACSPSPRLRT